MPKNRFLQIFLIATLAVSVLAVAAPGQAEEVAAIEISAAGVAWYPVGTEAAGIRLVVAGPDDVRRVHEFAPGEVPSLSLFDEAGAVLPDGVYTWEVKTVPVARRRGEIDDGARGLGRSSDAAKGRYQAGYLTIRDGAFQIPQQEPSAPKDLEKGNGIAERTTFTDSLCVGFDCPAGPAFGDSTILMMEHNTRIKFADTSDTPNPRNDWEIEANSSSSTGASYLGFNDCGPDSNTGGCASDLVFAVEAGAPASSLYVDNSGRVGLGTSSPVVELHVVDGDTPNLRLEQDTSSGFAAQTWDVAGNETSFFVRDVTNGSTLPFRIRPGAASNTLVVDEDSQVGIRDLSPDDFLDIDIDANGGFTIESTTESNLPQVTLLHPNRTWRFRVNSGGNFVYTDATAGTAPMQIRGGSATGLLILNGTTATVGGNLTVTDDLNVGGVKNFVQAHPEDPSRDLYFAALEGPEAGTYHRGTGKTVDGVAVIELPEAFAVLTETEGMTVQLTPIGGMHQLWVEERTPERIVVREATGKDGAEFDFFVQGVRLGYSEYQVARPAAD